MQLPYRKAGKYSHLKPDQHLTEAKLNELKRKLDRLKYNRPAAADEVKRLAEFGDFSENAEYQIAKGRLRGINQRILELEDQLRRAIIIKPNKNSQVVQLGSSVTVTTADTSLRQSWRGGGEITYLILGSSETNPGRGIISSRSPIGAGLIGKRVGDNATIKLAEKEVKYKIIKIE